TCALPISGPEGRRTDRSARARGSAARGSHPAARTRRSSGASAPATRSRAGSPSASRARLREDAAARPRHLGSPLVRPVCTNEIVDLVVRVDRFTGVAPEPVEDVELHRALLDVPVVDVRDLELTAARRF